PGIGRAVAEELLPAFKCRFDLVERGQVARVLDELKLGAPDLIDQAQGRLEVGRVAGVRYLVVGSLTPLAGVTAQARLGEGRSGLMGAAGRVAGAEGGAPLAPPAAPGADVDDDGRAEAGLRAGPGAAGGAGAADRRQRTAPASPSAAGTRPA